MDDVVRAEGGGMVVSPDVRGAVVFAAVGSVPDFWRRCCGRLANVKKNLMVRGRCAEGT